MRRVLLFVLGIVLFLAGIYVYVSVKYLSPYEFEIIDKIQYCVYIISGITISILCCILKEKR